MKNPIKIMIIALVAVLAACSGPIDPFNEFTDGEEIRYAGKGNDLTYLAGRDRLAIKFVLGPDPNVTEATIYWNLKKKSVVVPINRDELVDNTVTQLIEELPENTYNFEVYTSDKFGNISVPSHITAKTFGQRYEATLYNRNIAKMTWVNESEGKDVKLYLDDNPAINYALGIDMIYYKTNGTKVEHFVPADETTYVMEDFDYSKPLKYTTRFVPTPDAIDTFSPDPATITIVLADLEPDVPLPDPGPGIKLPYSLFNLKGDTPMKDFQYMQDGLKCTTYPTVFNDESSGSWVSEVSWKSCYSSRWPDDMAADVGGVYGAYERSPIWFTIDFGESVKLHKSQMHFYYPFYKSYLGLYEIWAYTADGEPIPGEWNGEDADADFVKAPWGDDWVKVATSDEHPPRQSLGDWEVYSEKYKIQAALYKEGSWITYPETAPTARYYRLKCIRGGDYEWDKTPEEQGYYRAYMFSISEMTFWKAFDE